MDNCTPKTPDIIIDGKEIKNEIREMTYIALSAANHYLINNEHLSQDMVRIVIANVVTWVDALALAYDIDMKEVQETSASIMERHKKVNSKLRECVETLEESELKQWQK